MNASELLISKELLSEVLGYQVTKISLLNTRTNSINITGDTEKYTPRTTSISIYALQHLCKEWALSKGHTFNVQMSNDRTLVYIGSINVDISAKTEPEAIFKACDFILRKIK